METIMFIPVYGVIYEVINDYDETFRRIDKTKVIRISSIESLEIVEVEETTSRKNKEGFKDLKFLINGGDADGAYYFVDDNPALKSLFEFFTSDELEFFTSDEFEKSVVENLK